MALPVGITTCTVTTGIPYDFGGASEIKTTIIAQPTLDLTWDATGDPILAFPMRATGDAGMPVQLALPHVDQPGFSQAGHPVTHWGYRLTVTWTGPNGAKQRVINNFQPVVGQATVDLDMTADQVPAPASIGNIPFVTSVNGESGAVTVGDYTPGGSSGVTVTDTPTAPAEGVAVSYFVTAAVVWPAGLEWSVDPDGGTAPTVTGTALVSLFTAGGVTRAVMGATFPAPPAPADTTAPSIPAGLSATAASSTSVTLAWSASTDDTAVTGYEYRVGGGAAVDAGAVLTETVTDLTASTPEIGDAIAARL